jgi:hypothetical protein
MSAVGRTPVTDTVFVSAIDSPGRRVATRDPPQGACALTDDGTAAKPIRLKSITADTRMEIDLLIAVSLLAH